MDIELFDKKYVYFDFNDVSKLKGMYGFGSDTYKDLIWRVNENARTNSWYPCKYSDDTSRPFHLGTGENVRFFYYDPFYEMKLAFKKGETLQYKCKNGEKWYDYEANHMPFFDTIDIFDWRVKPTETWYVVFVGHDFMRVSIINNEFNTVFFKGTYEECGKWINEHYSLSSIVSAFLRGDTIQWKPKNRINEWQDWKSSEFPTVNTMDENYWRIKPKYSHEKYKRRMTNRELSEYLAKGNGEVKNLGYIINTSISYCYKDNAENEIVDGGIFIRDFGSDEWRSPLIEL